MRTVRCIGHLGRGCGVYPSVQVSAWAVSTHEGHVSAGGRGGGVHLPHPVGRQTPVKTLDLSAATVADGKYSVLYVRSLELSIRNIAKDKNMLSFGMANSSN